MAAGNPVAGAAEAAEAIADSGSGGFVVFGLLLELALPLTMFG